MKELALKASQKQFEEVIAKFKQEAEKGMFECRFENLSDGTTALLRKNGYVVEPIYYRALPTTTSKVSIKS